MPPSYNVLSFKVRPCFSRRVASMGDRLAASHARRAEAKAASLAEAARVRAARMEEVGGDLSNCQSPPGNGGNRGNADVYGAKIRWSSQIFQPLMSRFPSGAVEF